MSFISNSLSSTNTYLTQQRAQANAYLTPQTSQAKAIDIVDSSKSGGDTKGIDNSVTLSPIGQKMAAQDKLWSTLSPPELKEIFDRSWGSLVKLDDKFRAIGMTAFDADIPVNGTPEKIDSATKMRDYMVSLHSLPTGKVANPYAGYSRESLSSILYDESGTYSDSERYAAGAEQQKQDFLHFSVLFADNTINPDHRKMYLGILDFYDKLSPVEQSAYPPGYRNEVNEYLRQEETIFGVLSESDKKAAMDKNRSESKLIVKSDEPIWRQLVDIPARLSGKSKV